MLAIRFKKILLQRDCSFDIAFQKSFKFVSNMLFVWVNVDFCVSKFVRIIIWFEIRFDINDFNLIRKLNHIIYVVLRELTFHLFAIFFSLFVIFIFVLIKCRICDFYNEKFSNENKKRSWNHEFSTFNELTFNDLNFEIDFFFFFYNLLLVINYV